VEVRSEAPACLAIYTGCRLIGQVLANRYREDFERAGLGSGRHGFAFSPPKGADFAVDAVQVRRSLDGAALLVRAHARQNLRPSVVA